MNKTILFLGLCIAVVFSIGILMVFNTTSAEILSRSLETSTNSALVKQAIYALIGIFFGLLILIIGYERVIEFAPYFFWGSVILLILVFIPHVGLSINGARRWIGFLGYTIQPSEFAKYLIPIFFINRLEKYKYFLDFKSFFFIILLFAIPILLILVEPDTGTTVIIIFTLVALFFITRIKFLYWALPLFVIAVIGFAAALNMPHVSNRIKVYLHPETDLKGKGHQPYQAKIAVGSGKLFGRGIGQSLQKLDYLPEARNDYIAAIYAEEVGFLGVCFLVGLYMTISALGFYIASKAKNRESFYLATILTFLISFQAFLNLGIVSALLPSKGTTLPFFSQGGSSLIVNLIAVSLLISIAKNNFEKKWQKEF